MWAWTPKEPSPPIEPPQPQPGTEPWDDTRQDDLDYGDEPAEEEEEEEDE